MVAVLTPPVCPYLYTSPFFSLSAFFLFAVGPVTTEVRALMGSSKCRLCFRRFMFKLPDSLLCTICYVRVVEVILLPFRPYLLWFRIFCRDLLLFVLSSVFFCMFVFLCVCLINCLFFACVCSDACRSFFDASFASTVFLLVEFRSIPCVVADGIGALCCAFGMSF